MTSYGLWITGNPYLKSNLTHNISMQMMLLQFNLSAGLYISPNTITSITETNRQNGQLTQTTENIAYVQPNVSIKRYFDPIRLSEQLNLRFGFGLKYRYQRYKQDNYGICNAGHLFSGDIFTGFTYKLPENIKIDDLDLQIFYFDDGIGHSVSPQGMIRNETKRLIASLSTGFGNFSLNIEYATVFPIGHTHIKYTENNTPTYKAYIYDNQFTSDRNTISASLSYRFAYGIKTKRKNHQQSFTDEDNSLYR